MQALTPAQRAAFEHVTRVARAYAPRVADEVREILEMSNLSPEALAEATTQLQTHARVAIHFHPDRPTQDDTTVAESMVRTGRIQSQFETGLSNGGLSSYPGGPRYRWETNLFGGAYDGDNVVASERPKYGALDLMRHPDGACPRFGSCYFLLRPEVSRRCSFTYLDSHLDPDEKGTYDAFEAIMAALLRDAFVSEWALGEKDLRVPRLLRHLREDLQLPYSEPSGRVPARNLNHCVEAQVHGDVALAYDVEALVADPSFQGTATGEHLHRLCQTFGLALRWHDGFVLAASDVPDDFRGPAMPSLAERVARDGVVDARAIGCAAVALKGDPSAWRDRGSYGVVLQELKLLWHVLVRFGRQR